MPAQINLRRIAAGAVTALIALMATLSVARPAGAETADEIVWKYFGSQRVGGLPAAGERPLAIGLLAFSDRKIPQNWNYYDGLTFGTGGQWPNIRSLFRDSSYGRFTWSSAGVYGPYLHPDDERTTADESTRRCVLDDPAGCPGVGLVTLSLPDNDSTDDDGRPFFLAAPGGGGAGSVVDARAREAGEFERFTLVDVNRGSLMHRDVVNLVAYNGQYLTAENGGGGPIAANRTAAREWERFVVVKRDRSVDDVVRHGDRIALQAYNRKYVSAINGGGGDVLANRTVAGSWETFTFSEIAHDEGRLSRASLQEAARSGLNFAAYAGSDGFVNGEELGFLRVIADGTAGAQCCNARPVRIPNQNVTVQPALTKAASDTFSISIIAHELTHAIASEQHLYGTNDNSFRLTVFSTGMGQADGTFHHDPWFKFLFGWLRPVFVRLDVPTNGCRYMLAADDDSDEFLQSASLSPTAPILLYNPTRPGEYYFAEYRKQEGSDRDAASTGLVLWLIKNRDDGRLAEVPGQAISGGTDNRIDSALNTDSDDVYVASAGFDNKPRIYPGPDRYLDTAVDKDDSRGIEPVNIAIGAPRDDLGRPVTRRRYLWGGNQAWKAGDGVIRPAWTDGTDSRARIQIGTPSGAPGTALPIEIAAGRAFVPDVRSVSPSTVPQGSTITVTGQMLGVRGSKRIIARSASGTLYPLPILSWPACERATVRIPSALPAGNYQVYVEGDGDPRVNSISRGLLVVPATP